MKGLWTKCSVLGCFFPKLIYLCRIWSFFSCNTKDSQSIIFSSDQKMSLRTFYFIDVHRTCGQISTWSALSAIFWPQLKTSDLEPLSVRVFSFNLVREFSRWDIFYLNGNVSFNLLINPVYNKSCIFKVFSLYSISYIFSYVEIKGSFDRNFYSVQFKKKDLRSLPLIRRYKKWDSWNLIARLLIKSHSSKWFR